eukprot:CAMPEP_0180571840 /NCGR_PEP_ID=MMETSP1037_2-20121125/8934_1 /TAXON_ID=632150 /ORGANISM="Azadinium spinosum, Strain 3D9" /LENGTH=55 /DNA_ID=CAMNT_0022589185 /DNA_START=70 /DNA_END=234 /DNA_ORIENTATION=+
MWSEVPASLRVRPWWQQLACAGMERCTGRVPSHPQGWHGAICGAPAPPHEGVGWP